MGAFIPVFLAEGFAIKALAVLALGLVAYLYWTGFKEKRAERRHRRWQEDRRREFEARLGQTKEPPQ